LALDLGLFGADKKSTLGGNPRDIGWNLGRLGMRIGIWDVQILAPKILEIEI